MKKILALLLSIVFLALLCACRAENAPSQTTTDPKFAEYLPPQTGSTKTADATAASFETVTVTTDPSATVEIPERVNGTYACGCAELTHGDYSIGTSKGAVITRAGKEISAGELVRGETIAVHFSGMILMMYPGVLTKVTLVEVLPEGADPEEYETNTCMVLRVSCIMGSTVYGEEI